MKARYRMACTFTDRNTWVESGKPGEMSWTGKQETAPAAMSW